ncbi:MAG: DUF4402 domain-containing protein [bacterium]
MNWCLTLEVCRLVRRVAGLAAISAMLLPAGPTAQDVAVGGAEAIVQTALSVTSSADLNFGDVLQGVPTTVVVIGSDAAVFQITGQSQAGIELVLFLPEYMSLSDNSDRMPVIFGSTLASVDTTAAHDPTDAGISGWLGVDPRNLPAAAIIGSSGTDVYLGGKVVPSANQKAGNYSADIVLTVAYNGI